MMKSLVFSLSLFLSAVAMTPRVCQAAVIHMDMSELAAEADRIIIGDVVSVTSAWEDHVLGELIMSDVRIQITDDLKGAGPQAITLHLFGGTVEDMSLFTSVTPTFLQGDHVLLFLKEADNEIVGAFQGAYLNDGISAVQMQGGQQRMIQEEIMPLQDLLDQIALYVETPLPEPSGYTGSFSLSNTRQANYVLASCNWGYQANPMFESFRFNGNCVSSGCGTEQTVFDAFVKSAAVWDNAGTDYYFNYFNTTPLESVSFNGINIVFFEQAYVGLPSSAIAATYFWCSGSSMTEWDMLFNEFNFIFWDGATGSCGGFRYDIQSVGAHELGHALGLSHSQFSSATMWSSTGPCNLAPRTLHSDDRNGASFIYGNADSNLPFVEDFPSITLDGSKWILMDGVAANSSGFGEPSEPNALNLDGYLDGGNSISSNFLNLSGMSGLKLNYFYQRTGGGDAPESGDDLIVEYSRANTNSGLAGQWTELNRHFGDGPDMDTFEYVSLDLPGAAYHSDFHIRFRVLSNETGLDDWYVDDICIGSPEDCPEPGACAGDFNGDDAVNVDDLLLMLAAWGACPGCPADLDGSGSVDIADLLQLLALWGPC